MAEKPMGPTEPGEPNPAELCWALSTCRKALMKYMWMWMEPGRSARERQLPGKTCL